MKLFFISLFLFSFQLLADGVNEPSHDSAWPSSNSVASYQMPVKKGRKPRQPMSKRGWSGGASYSPPGSIPVALEGKEAPENSKMDLSHKDLMKDDGGQTISASIPPTAPNSYAYGIGSLFSRNSTKTETLTLETSSEEHIPDVSREWIAKEGETLKSVLKKWALNEGWEIVWNTHRSYPLKAGAKFNGRFTDVSSALIRTFGRATPPPYAKFYYGNRVLVLKTLEDENAD